MNNDLANTIRSKVDIVDIIGERIPLIARGKNLFGVCPFHEDSNPSMCVSRDRQIYTCWSCHATGNVYTFLMNYEHIDFKEALKYLGDRVGIDTGSIQIAKKTTKFDKLYDAYNLSLKYFQNNLNSNVGKIAKKYLNDTEWWNYLYVGYPSSFNGKTTSNTAEVLAQYPLVDIDTTFSLGRPAYESISRDDVSLSLDNLSLTFISSCS